jgi:histone H3/H4
MPLINKSKVKEETELQLSEEFYTALDKKVDSLIKESEQRAKANGRRTLLARDI